MREMVLTEAEEAAFDAELAAEPVADPLLLPVVEASDPVSVDALPVKVAVGTSVVMP